MVYNHCPFWPVSGASVVFEIKLAKSDISMETNKSLQNNSDSQTIEVIYDYDQTDH